MLMQFLHIIPVEIVACLPVLDCRKSGRGFGHQGPECPEVVAYAQHELHIFGQALILARVEDTGFLDFLFIDMLIHFEPRHFLQVVKAALVQQIGNIVGHVIVACVFEIYEQQFFILFRL